MTGHLPYGVVVIDGRPRPAVRVGDRALDLAAAEAAGLLDAGGTLRAGSLNPFLAAGPEIWRAVRDRLPGLVAEQRLLHPLSTPVLPFEVGDYVDFYSSEHHATNAGRIFRPGQPPLLPNWKHLPVGYHGRAGTVIVSGTPVTRPCGQLRSPDGPPTFGPSARLDVEAEVGFVIGVPSATPITVDRFADHVFGVVLVNDWSARDLQGWEAQPLGPFLSKSFATSIGAWITPLAALEAAWVPLPPQEPPVLDYLREPVRRGLDLALTIRWNGTVVSRPPFATMYWTPAQQLAHLTVAGASVRTGDLYASGTVSGPDRDQVGSFLELSWGGAEPIELADGSERTFLRDGDTVTIEATALGIDGEPISLAEVTGTIRPASC
jgi:fumarylacetoacetase